MTKKYEFNWRLPIPKQLQEGDDFDRWQEVNRGNEAVVTLNDVREVCFEVYVWVNLFCLGTDDRGWGGLHRESRRVWLLRLLEIRWKGTVAAGSVRKK